ncbi:MAG: GNAT family N-acetyltransferase [Phycisphaeraceae bacterium]
MIMSPAIETRTIDGRRGFVLPESTGSRVFYTPVVPADAPRLRAGVAALSAASRRFRFLGSIDELSDEQVERFTHPDQTNHVAWAALDVDDPAMPGLGLGRMIREENDPALGEIALAVIDAWQHRGLGTTLLAILLARAEAVSLRRVHAWVAPDNRRVIGWFGRLGVNWVGDLDPWEAHVNVPYMPPGTAPPRSAADRLARTVELVRPIVNEPRQA